MKRTQFVHSSQWSWNLFWISTQHASELYDLDIQAFGVSVEELEKFISNGIITWGEPVRNIMEDGELAVNQARTSERTPLVTILLSGEREARCLSTS